MALFALGFFWELYFSRMGCKRSSDGSEALDSEAPWRVPSDELSPPTAMQLKEDGMAAKFGEQRLLTRHPCSTKM